MTTVATLNSIATLYGSLGAGEPDEKLQRVLFQQLASAFSQLSVDMAAETGWTAATGTATKGGFVTGTVTLPNLAQSVKALIDTGLAKGTISP